MKIPARRRKRRFFQLKRNPKIFVPLPSEKQLVVPFRFLSVGTIFILSFLCVYLAFRSDLFWIHTIELETPQSFSTEIFAQEVKLAQGVIEREAKGRSIFFVNAKAIKDRILKNFLTVERISLEKNFPNRLKVAIEERKPVAVVRVGREARSLPAGRQGRRRETKEATSSATEKSQAMPELTEDFAKLATGSAVAKRFEWFAVDREGLLFAKVATFSGIPALLYISEPIGLGEKVGGEKVKATLEILEKLKKWEIKVKTVLLSGFANIEVVLEDDISVSFSSFKSVPEQVASLQLILSQAKIEAKLPKKIDLRFNRAVVVY